MPKHISTCSLIVFFLGQRRERSAVTRCPASFHTSFTTFSLTDTERRQSIRPAASTARFFPVPEGFYLPASGGRGCPVSASDSRFLRKISRSPVLAVFPPGGCRALRKSHDSPEPLQIIRIFCVIRPCLRKALQLPPNSAIRLEFPIFHDTS